MTDLSELKLQIEILLLQSQHFEGLLLAITAFFNHLLMALRRILLPLVDCHVVSLNFLILHNDGVLVGLGLKMRLSPQALELNRVGLLMVMRVVLSNGAFYSRLGLTSLLRCGDGLVLLHFQLLLLVLLHV